jgi:HAD superfamily hydrolase (TIGR01490 family)
VEFLEEFCHRCLAPRLLPAGLRRIAWHRDQGHRLILVSASVDLYLQPVATRLGFDHLVCTRATLVPSPHLVGPNCRGDEKVRRLLQEPYAQDLAWEESWAYGDSVSDLPLLERCGHPVAVHARGPLRRRARRAGWAICDW